jgi:hypothetical protein
MAHTRRTACKSTGRLPVDQLAPRNVPQPQESQPDTPQEASPEEEPFEIEVVVLRAQRLRTRRLKSNNRRTMAQKTRPTKSTLPRVIPNLRRYTEMLTRWSPSELNLQSSPAGFELCYSTWASPPLPGTGSRKSCVQGEWSSRPSQRFSSDPRSSADTRDQPSGLRAAMLLPMPPGRPSHHGSVATRAGCRTRSTTSYLTGRRINSRPTG